MEMVLAVLITQLSADDFQTRDRAHVALVRLGPVAHPHLLTAEKSKDPETRARARQILDPWFVANAERFADEHGAMPWIDLDTDGYWWYMQQVEGCFSSPPDYLRHRKATRLLVVDMYRRRCSRAEVCAVLNVLWEKEHEWKAKHQPPAQDD